MVSSATGAPSPQTEEGSSARTILLVEDESAVRSVLTRFLCAKGYTVIGAENALVAEPLWREHRERIILLITDVMLPNGVSGCQLAGMLQAENPKLHVILTSGYNNEFAEFAAGVASHTQFIPKPYSPDQLLGMVEGVFASAVET